MEQLTFQGNTLRIDKENGAAITYWSCQKNTLEVAPINNQSYHKFEGSLLFPFPNRLASGSYTFEGIEYQFDINDGDNRPNALHGLIHSVEFSLIEKLEDSIRLRYEYEGELAAYPFPYTFEVEYKLTNNELEIVGTVVNTGSENMPCGFGWHPYFDIQLADQSPKFKLQKASKIDVNDVLIPTGTEAIYKTFQELKSIEGISLDNCFRLEKIEERSSCFLSYPGIGTLEIWQDHNFPFIQVYKPDERAMAIEPMTCGINAFNTLQGLKKLSPQETWAFKMGLRFF